MEKTIAIEKTEQRNYHCFYCDECNEPIGDSIECEDGYYQEHGVLEFQFYVGSWYKFKKHLCDKCRTNYILKIQSTLENMGFCIKD